jgi:hypothetical protein
MGTHMSLIALVAQGLASWDGVPSAKERVRGKIESCLTGTFLQEAEDYEDDARIKRLPAHLHRQMDTADFVLA